MLSTLMLQQTAQPGIWDFFLQSGPVARVVLGVLVLFSVGSWTIMISKALQLQRANRHNEAFLEVFRKSSRFSEINAVTARFGASPLVGLFQAGYIEIDAQVKAEGARTAAASPSYRIRSLPAVERSLRRASGVEMQILGRHTPFLATTAAATPFIGLFGTVWGIMVAFSDIGASGSASIVDVAPGIAEALVNTAGGLGAAIPALVGYNYLAGRLRGIRGDMEDFSLEFVNMAERNFT
jgi:biopolymer transport protein TolQ